MRCRLAANGSARRWVLAFGAAVLLLPACAPVEPVTRDPATTASAHPALDFARDSALHESYRAPDGRELAYLAYRSPDTPADTAVVLLHDRADHAEHLALAAARLSALGAHTYIVDRRGAGRNRENRDLTSGDAASAEALLADVDGFIATIGTHYDRVVLAGFGWGGKLALAYDLAHPGRLGGLVLIAPDLGPEPEPSPADRLRLLGAARFAPTSAVALPEESELAAADPGWRAYLAGDPLRLRQVTARFVLASRDLDARIAQAATRRATPALLLLAGQDRIVDNEAAKRLLGQGAAGTLTVIAYPGQAHALPLEAPGRLTDDVDAWLGTFSVAQLEGG